MFLTYSLHALPWDIILIVLLSGAALLGRQSLRWARGSAQSRLQRYCAYSGFMGSCLAILILLYGSFVEPQLITVTERRVTLPLNPGETLRIAVLSDMHVGPYKGRRYLARVVERVNALEPDFVFLLGDFIFFEYDPVDDLSPLRDLHPRYETYAIMGNHEHGCYTESPLERLLGGGSDHSLPVRRALERSSVTVLRNEWKEVQTEGRPVFISGVDDLCSHHDRIGDVVPELQRRSVLILLAHSPDVILEGEAKRYHLILAGHTHGGQIRLPFIGPIPPLPTQLGRRYDQGLFPVDANTTLAITRGIGESGPRARLFATPEILLLQARGEAL
ncbi:MAG: metallophosphoesterase [Patescibacteria group bacterium]